MNAPKDPALQLSRRAVVAGGLGAVAAPHVIRTALAKASELRLLTWEGYAADPWVDAFEQAHGVECKITYVGSADEMFAKSVGSKGQDYDVLSFDTSAFARYLDSGLLQPVAMDRIANAANLAPAFRDVAAVVRDGKPYGVPFAWGSLPLVYSEAEFPTVPASWEVMWDPRYAQRMISQDDANNCTTLAALVLGVPNPFKLTDAEFEQVKAKLIEQKKLLLTYYAGFEDGVKIFAESDVVLMYSMGEPQVPMLKDKGVKAAMTIPEEGAIGWLDCWTISAGAKDVDLANAWIDACLDRSVGAYLSDKLKYGNTTDEAANARNGVTYGGRLTWLETPESIEKRVKIWNEVKAAI